MSHGFFKGFLEYGYRFMRYQPTIKRKQKSKRMKEEERRRRRRLRGISRANQHIFILGTSGMGKTTVMYAYVQNFWKKALKGELPRGLGFIPIEFSFERNEFTFFNIPANKKTDYWLTMQDNDIEPMSFPVKCYAMLGDPEGKENAFYLPNFFEPIYIAPHSLSLDDWKIMFEGDASGAQLEGLQNVISQLEPEHTLFDMIAMIQDSANTEQLVEFGPWWMKKKFQLKKVDLKQATVDAVVRKLRMFVDYNLFAPKDPTGMVTTVDVDFMRRVLSQKNVGATFYLPLFSEEEGGLSNIPENVKTGLIRYFIKTLRNAKVGIPDYCFAIVNDFGDMCRNQTFAEEMEWILNRGRDRNLFLMANSTMMPPKPRHAIENTLWTQFQRKLIFSLGSDDMAKQAFKESVPTTHRISPDIILEKYREDVFQQRHRFILMGFNDKNQFEWIPQVDETFVPHHHGKRSGEDIRIVWDDYCRANDIKNGMIDMSHVRERRRQLLREGRDRNQLREGGKTDKKENPKKGKKKKKPKRGIVREVDGRGDPV